jgi:hypothetical protein
LRLCENNFDCATSNSTPKAPYTKIAASFRKVILAMKIQHLSRLCMLSLLMLVFLFPCAGLVSADDDTTIVVFSRHTFRGISKTIGPQKIFLGQYGIELPIPMLSYGQDATPQGLIIAEQFAAPGLQQAAALAVERIDENKVFDNHWDEVRADLASERTFWTGLYLIKGIQEQDPVHNHALKFTGCPIDPKKDHDAIDVVSSDHPVKSCTGKDAASKHAFLRLLETSPDLPALKATFRHFLNTVRAAIGLNPPVDIPDPVYSEDGALPKDYDQIAALASIIEMIAELGPPLPQIFRDSDHPPIPQLGKLAVQRGVNSLGIRFFTSEPSPLSDAVSVFPVNYMMSRPKGSHTIVVSHDNMMSALMSSLGIISGNSDPDDWAFYPIESYVFAFGRSNVSVVRMRVQIRNPDGAIPGDFASEVVWRGSRETWDKKVQALNDRAKTLDLGNKGNDCVSSVKECKAHDVKVVFSSEPF